MTDPRPDQLAWWTDLHRNRDLDRPRGAWQTYSAGRHATHHPGPQPTLRPAPTPWTFLTGLAVGVPAGAIASSLWWLW